MSFKPDLEFQQTFQKQMASIKQKQDEIIKVYDLIISNKVAHIEK